MGELLLPPELSSEMTAIYATMEECYEQTAEQVSLTCQGCPDNCCDSYFLHYTYCEWAYLWEGLRKLEAVQRDRIMEQASAYVSESTRLIRQQIRPQIPCPLLDGNGLCSLYSHRLMICRTHGVPATLTRPDGQSMRFPGCFRCQENVKQRYQAEIEAPAMDRTDLYKRLALLESRVLGHKRHLYPRIKMTIAEMIEQGPPQDIQSCLQGEENGL